VLSPAHAGGHQSNTGQLAQVASPDRADGGHDRVDTGVEHRDQSVGRTRAGTRAAPGDAVEADGHRGPNQLGRQRRPEAAGVGHDQRLLQAADLLIGKLYVLQVTYARIQPIDRSAAGQGGVHHGPAGADQGPGARAQLNPGTPGDFQQLLNGEWRRCDGDDGHATSGAGRSAPQPVLPERDRADSRSISPRGSSA
jgi:hypothetical protein